MTRLILVRHGQTAWNRQERFRGRSDLPLDETGLAQAQATARHIAARWSVSAVYASPLPRAMQTAAAIAATCDLTVQPLPGLVDIDYGFWQGLSPAEVAQRDPEQHRLWLTAPQRARIPGGENLPAARRRAFATLRQAAARHDGQTIVLVSHLVICRLLLLAVLGLPTARYWQIRQETAAINVIEYAEGRFTLVILNDTCHLDT
jgi:broad specificity phosphatase PhoE